MLHAAVVGKREILLGVGMVVAEAAFFLCAARFFVAVEIAAP